MLTFIPQNIPEKRKKKVLTLLQNIIRQKNKYDMKKIGKTTRFHKINSAFPKEDETL